MTRSKIQKIKFYVTLLLFLLAQTTFCDGHYRDEKDAREQGIETKSVVQRDAPKNVSPATNLVEGNAPQNPTPAVDATKSRNGTNDTHITSKHPVDVTNKPSVTTEPPKQQPAGGHLKSLDTGALIRGFYVFAGLSVLVTAYIVFRRSRLSKSRAQMIRKYGVLAHRQDVEMRPLPLEEEDEEDTTVFDASNIMMNDAQRQNL